jgi:hypothetical protein
MGACRAAVTSVTWFEFEELAANSGNPLQH